MWHSLCLQLALSPNLMLGCVFTVGASTMTQVPFSKFGRRAQYPYWSASGILHFFPQLTSLGLEWPIGIRCFNLRPGKWAQYPYGGKAGRCDLGFAISHVSKKVKGGCDRCEQGSNQNEAERKDGESTDRTQVLGPSHLWGCLLLQFIWAVHASFYPTWFVLSFCY